MRSWGATPKRWSGVLVAAFVCVVTAFSSGIDSVEAIAIAVPRATTPETAAEHPLAMRPGEPVSAQVASSLLSQLAIAPEQATNSYDRDYFGSWTDADRDRCNTRKEVLLAEATSAPQASASCKLSGGSWSSAFDAVHTIDSSKFDVDHMVPLKEAWVSGAHGWSLATLRSYANDLGYEHSLVAVTASSNRSKGDQDPAEWMPSNRDFVCEYVARWVAVKYRWSLSADPAEATVLRTTLDRCGAVEVAEPARAEIAAGNVAAVVEAVQTGAVQPNSTQAVVFANCDALRAVFAGGVAALPGAQNLVSGAPRASRVPITIDAATYEANRAKDRDRDGVACEQ